jgi:hypothetical protein
MEVMMKTLIVAFALMMVCTVVCGQTHKVVVSAQDSDANAVVDALKAKLGGTLRYQLTDNAVVAELFIDVQCMKTYNPGTGFACAAIYFYYPPELVLTRLHLGSSLHSGSDPSLTAESMFEIFVNNSSEDVLKKKEADHLGNIRYACTLHGANHDEIKADAVKAACTGRASVSR